MNQTALWFAALLCLAVGVQAAPERPTTIGSDKKLIEWGWDEPGTAYLRENAARMDQFGFDGVIFHPDVVHDGKKARFTWECWGATRFEADDFRQAVADLRACRFQRLTDNFMRFNVTPGDVDWFDDAAFAVVTHNAQVAAEAARLGRCKGFMFDIEIYNKPLFTYDQQAHKETKSFAEYEEKVRQRGQELMRAMQAGYPDITILLTFGYEITGVGGDRSKARYGLLKNLLDGMLEAATGKAMLVDAYEGAYGFRRQAQFAEAYRNVHEGMLPHTAAPDAYRKRMSAGFGLWMDMNWRRYGWHADNFERNYFTPAEFENSLFLALARTDRYVWVYTEKPQWWQEQDLPAEYRRALQQCRQPRVVDDARFPDRTLQVEPGAK